MRVIRRIFRARVFSIGMNPDGFSPGEYVYTYIRAYVLKKADSP